MVSKVNPVKQGSDLGGVPTKFVVSITREKLESDPLEKGENKGKQQRRVDFVVIF